MTLTFEQANEILHYDPETGILRWRVDRIGGKGAVRFRAGDVAGSRRDRGYLGVTIAMRPYKVHRLAWLLYHGEWPTKGVDHINGVKDDNRIANLREASQAENVRNQGVRSTNTSGYKGVNWHAGRGKWVAKITVDRKQKYLGLFDTPEAAYAAYQEAARTHFGEFVRSPE